MPLRAKKFACHLYEFLSSLGYGHRIRIKNRGAKLRIYIESVQYRGTFPAILLKK